MFSKLFGGKAKPEPEPEPERYEGFAIYPASQKDGGGYRLAARVEKRSEAK